eukprot:TRINITY_DN10092_c0_g1_i1.p1 TRINITY_DN10092_c0_g1~~TRINITY_DN10092_c0_g1_i1.p1  ORF type:complete len:259 (-),score=38.87 TRINITY_DN10092_c0_g1_i1:9-785(-)
MSLKKFLLSDVSRSLMLNPFQNVMYHLALSPSREVGLVDLSVKVTCSDMWNSGGILPFIDGIFIDGISACVQVLSAVVRDTFGRASTLEEKIIYRLCHDYIVYPLRAVRYFMAHNYFEKKYHNIFHCLIGLLMNGRLKPLNAGMIFVALQGITEELVSYFIDKEIEIRQNHRQIIFSLLWLLFRTFIINLVKFPFLCLMINYYSKMDPNFGAAIYDASRVNLMTGILPIMLFSVWDTFSILVRNFLVERLIPLEDTKL